MIDSKVLEMAKRLRLIAHEMEKHSKLLQDKHHTTIPQLICLYEIQKQGPITLSALGKAVFANASTVTGIVDRLERHGFVQRTRVSKDRRQIHVEITEEGIEFLKTAPQPLQEQLVEKLQDFCSEEFEEVLEVTDKLVDLIGDVEQPGN